MHAGAGNQHGGQQQQDQKGDVVVPDPDVPNALLDEGTHCLDRTRLPRRLPARLQRRKQRRVDRGTERDFQQHAMRGIAIEEQPRLYRQ